MARGGSEKAGVAVGVARALSQPVRDILHGLEVCLDGGLRALVLVFVGLAVGWWVYVPLHELLHVFGCVATGGSVSRLEVDPMYGGALLARIFPFVESGGDYAGRLSGFDTGGSDLVYLATDFAPFLLTLFPGVWAMRRAIRRSRAFLFGFWIAWAMAPFVSWTGDAYEIGSIVTVHLIRAQDATRELLVGDDIFRVAASLYALGASGILWTAMTLGIVIGTVWAFATYWCADRVAAWLGSPSAAADRPFAR